MKDRFERKPPSKQAERGNFSPTPFLLAFFPSSVMTAGRDCSMLLLQHILNGLLAGSYYLLIALGLSLIFSPGRHREPRPWRVLRHRRVSRDHDRAAAGFTAAVFVAPVLVGLLGVVVERLLLRRFYKADPALSLLLTFGLAMVIEQCCA